MARAGNDSPANRWFDRLLRGLPATVRYRLFQPAYEDAHQDHLLRVRAARTSLARAALRLAFVVRVVALTVACYRDSADFVFPNPFRSMRAGLRALVVSNRILLSHDVRQAVRLLRTQPGYCAVAIGILALALASSTAIFSVVDAVLLEPLPFPGASRLVALDETFAGRSAAVSPVNFFDWQREARSFEAMAIYAEQSPTLTLGDRAEAVTGYSVSSGFFRVLGLKPWLGRWFLAEDDRSPGPSSVVLSHGLWQRAFGGRPDIIGRPAIFDGEPFTVVGVVPAGFEFPEKTEAWFSLSLPERSRAQNARGAHYVSALARLKPAATLAQADAELRSIAGRLTAAYPRTNTDYGASVQLLVDSTVGSARTGLLLILGAVAFLLLIACVNVSGLMVARASTRRGEMAVRAALGAGRLALVRQVFVESLALSAVAALLGSVLAAWGTRALLAIVPADLPRAAGSGLNLRVLAFTAVVSVVSAVLSGCLPAAQSTGSGLAGSLKEARRDAGVGGTRRVRNGLVAAEVTLAVVLLVGAALAIRSFDLLSRVSPGFDPRGLLTFTVALPGGTYKEDAQVAAFYARLIERLNAVPGVRSASAVMIPPVSASGFGGTFSIEGRPDVPGGAEEPRAQVRPVTPTYFHTLGLPLVGGRAFDDRDGADAPPVAMVSESAARRYWPGEDPIGRRLRMHVSAVRARQPFREIVGVVSDVKNSTLDRPSAPMVYVPHAQHPAGAMAVMVRAQGAPALLEPAIVDALLQEDKTVVPLEMSTVEARLARSNADQRFRAVLLGLFAGTACLLAIVGLYAVVAYATGRRQHEIGIRMALGAGRAEVLRMVVGEGMGPVLVGLALGGVGAYAVARAMRGLLFGVQPFEPGIVVPVLAGFALAALAACYLPARRATMVDPTVALREE
jgi:putative ABC transport system permease protein